MLEENLLSVACKAQGCRSRLSATRLRYRITVAVRASAEESNTINNLSFEWLFGYKHDACLSSPELTQNLG